MLLGLFRAARMLLRRWSVLGLAVALVASVTAAVAVAKTSPPAAAASAVATSAADPTGDPSDPGDSPTSRPDEVSARLAARLAGTRFKITSLSTESSDTYANPDGTLTLDTAPAPYQAEVSDDVWQPIDTDLSVTTAGVVPKLAVAGAVLSKGGSGPLASLDVDGKTVSWSWPTPLPAPSLDGDTATYANVGGAAVPGEDLTVTAVATGFEINVVLNQAPAGGAGVTVPLSVSAPGLAVSRDSGGTLHLKNSAGTELADADSPVVYDHSGRYGSVHAPDQGAVTTALSGANLSYSVPGSYLHAASTDYPVTLDPGVVANLGRAHWAVVDVHHPTTTYYDSGTPQIGSNNSGTNVYRSFFQYNTAGIAGKHVLSATMNLGILSSGATCSAPTEYDLYSVNGDISSGTTWNNQPGQGTREGRYTSANGDGNASCPAGTVALSGGGTLALVQQWAAAGVSTATAGIYAANEQANTYYKSLNNAPNIAITYNTVPPAPGQLNVSACFFECGEGADINSTTPTLTAQAYDQDGGTLTYDFAVYSGSTAVASGSTTVTSPATASWQVPAGALVDGGTYYFQSRVFDGIDYSANSDVLDFQVDTTAPAAPQVSANGFVAGQWVAHGTTGDFSYTDSSPDAYAFAWNLDGAGWSSWSGSPDTGTLSPGDGEHTLQVLATDAAANLSLTVVNFGVGAGLTSPHDQQAQTAKFTPLAASAPSSTPYLTYQMRAGTTGTFSTLDPSTVTIPGTSTHPTWPQSGTVSGSTATFPALTLDAKTALGADGVLQLRGCFATDSSGTGTLCDSPTTVQVAAQTASTGTATVGPGSVDETSGNFRMGTTDVSVATATGTLSLGRSVSTVIANSAPPGAAGVFGPGWTADLAGSGAGAGSLQVADHSADGYVILTDPSGNELDYTRSDPSQTTFTGLADANDKSTLVANTAANPTSIR